MSLFYISLWLPLKKIYSNYKHYTTCPETLWQSTNHLCYFSENLFAQAIYHLHAKYSLKGLHKVAFKTLFICAILNKNVCNMDVSYHINFVWKLEPISAIKVTLFHGMFFGIRWWKIPHNLVEITSLHITSLYLMLNHDEKQALRNICCIN